MKSALHYSAIFNNYIAAEVLLLNGADVNIQENYVCFISFIITLFLFFFSHNQLKIEIKLNSKLN